MTFQERRLVGSPKERTRKAHAVPGSLPLAVSKKLPWGCRVSLRAQEATPLRQTFTRMK